MQFDRIVMFPDIPEKKKVNLETTRFKRESKINYSAQVMERFLYRGLFCWQPPGYDVNEQFLQMKRSAECSNRYYQLFGDRHPKQIANILASRLHGDILNQLYKGEDPITCEPVVLGGCISRDGLLNSLPKDSYQRNAMSGHSLSKDKWFHHYAAYIDLPQTTHLPEHLVKSCGIKPVEFKYEF